MRRVCPICQQETGSLLYRPRSAPGPVVRCQICGLIYVSPVQDSRAIIGDGPVLAGADPAILTSENLCDLSGCWELSQLPAKEAEWPALRCNAERALAQLHRHIGPPGRLLDFGCGWGFFLKVAQDHGWEPHGVEPLPGHAIYARSISDAQVVTGVLGDNTLAPGFFDVVTAFQVFEHLPDPAADLSRLHQALRPGGVILIEVPNIDTLGVRLLRARHRHFNPDHLTFFSGRTLSRLLQDRGFEVLSIYHPGRYMTVRHLTTYWGRRLLPRRTSHTLPMLAARLGLLSKILHINLGDIVAVVARKSSQ